MDSQLSLFGFEEAPSDKKEEVKAKSTTKKQVAKDDAPEISLFGENVNETPEEESNTPTAEITDEINNESVEQEEVINTASDENIFPTTENYDISEEEYQKLEESSEDDFPWEEQELPSEEIYTDTSDELENFAADAIPEDYSEAETIYVSEEKPELDVSIQENEHLNLESEFPTTEMSSEILTSESEPEYIEQAPTFEATSEIEREEPVAELESVSEENIVEPENFPTDLSKEVDTTTVENEPISEDTNEAVENIEDESILDEENSEPEYVEAAPITAEPVAELETPSEENIVESKNVTADLFNEANTTTVETELTSEDTNEAVESIEDESILDEENSEPEYVEAAPIIDSDTTITDADEIIEENSDASNKEIALDYPDFWDEKVEPQSVPSEEPVAKDLFGEVIIPSKKEVFKAGKRGRKSFKEIDAEVDLINVPDDDVLFSKQYYPISEVAKWFRVNNSLLRFWENEFDILKPRKNRKGDRLFRPEDIKNLQVIYYLLRNKKYTIDGAKKYLKTNKKTADVNLQIIHALNNFKGFLLELKANVS